jgi:hypothetical protein
MPEITIISMILTAALVLVSLFLIAYPYFSWDAYLNKQSTSSIQNDSKEVLLTTLNELEFDHKMEKMSDTDYFQLKKQYEVQVARILRAEKQKTSKEADSSFLAEIEREIEEAARKYKTNKGERMK